MRNKIVKVLLCLAIFFANVALSHIYQIDLTGNVKLTGTLSGKEEQEALLQIVAQNIRLIDGSNLEEHIKSQFPQKKDQLNAYSDLPTYATKLVENKTLSLENFKQIERNLKSLTSALDVANDPKNRRFFPSFYKVIEYIDANDPAAHIVINSFGKDIPAALEAIKDRFPNLTMSEKIATITNEGKIDYDDQLYELTELPFLAKKFKVLGLRSNYDLWKKGADHIGKPLILQSNDLETNASFLMDDNANVCLTVYLDGKLLSQDEGFNFAQEKGLVLQTDTAKALTDENYFVDFLISSPTFQTLLKSK